MRNRIHISKCPVDCLSLDEAGQFLQEKYDKDEAVTVVGANASTVVSVNSDKNFREALNAIDLVVPDGYWLQVAARWLRYPTTHHVPVVKMTYNLLERMNEMHAGVYLLGAANEVVDEAAREIERRYPGLRVVGTRNGYFDESEEQDIVSSINSSGAKMILIGISSPKRETFMVRNKEKLNVPLIIGVGGMIDILGGKTTEGPDWMLNSGLMWFYRFILEPRRLWKRYTVTNIKFVWMVFKQALNIRFLKYEKS